MYYSIEGLYSRLESIGVTGVKLIRSPHLLFYSRASWNILHGFVNWWSLPLELRCTYVLVGFLLRDHFGEEILQALSAMGMDSTIKEMWESVLLNWRRNNSLQISHELLLGRLPRAVRNLDSVCSYDTFQQSTKGPVTTDKLHNA